MDTKPDLSISELQNFLYDGAGNPQAIIPCLEQAATERPFWKLVGQQNQDLSSAPVLILMLAAAVPAVFFFAEDGTAPLKMPKFISQALLATLVQHIDRGGVVAIHGVKETHVDAAVAELLPMIGGFRI